MLLTCCNHIFLVPLLHIVLYCTIELVRAKKERIFPSLSTLVRIASRHIYQTVHMHVKTFNLLTTHAWGALHRGQKSMPRLTPHAQSSIYHSLTLQHFFTIPFLPFSALDISTKNALQLFVLPLKFEFFTSKLKRRQESIELNKIKPAQYYQRVHCYD